MCGGGGFDALADSHSSRSGSVCMWGRCDMSLTLLRVCVLGAGV